MYRREVGECMEHIWITGCKTGNCGGTCHYCTLSICEVCGLCEGALTTECCGENAASHSDAVYNAQEDFVGGRWTLTPSPHSPYGVEILRERL